MATERLDIIVTEKGAKTVSRNIQQIGTSAKSAAGGVGVLARALGGLGAAFSARAIFDQINAYQNLQNRLRNVSTDAKNLGQVQERLFQIANKTGQSFESTATVFSRFAVGARELGASQEDIAVATENINQLVKLSGASATEAAGGLLQLSQGFASGTLKGEEINSVLENLPRVADAIAASMGTTRGQLKGLAKDGKITSAEMLKAFKTLAPEIQAEVAKLEPTVGQQLQVLQNTILDTVGRLSQGLGLDTALADGIGLVTSAIEYVRQNLQTIVPIIQQVANALKVTLVAGGIKLAITAFGQLAALLARNPFAVLITAIAYLVQNFNQVLNAVNQFSPSLATLLNIIGTGVNKVLEFGQALVTGFSQGSAEGSALQQVFNAIGTVAEAVFGFIVNTAIPNMAGAIGGAIQIVKNIGIAFSNIGVVVKTALNVAIGAIEKLVNAAIKGINAVIELANKVPGVSIGTVGEVGLGRLTEGATQGFGSVTDAASAAKAATTSFIGSFKEIPPLAEKVKTEVKGAKIESTELSTAAMGAGSALNKMGEEGKKAGDKTKKGAKKAKDEVKKLTAEAQFVADAMQSVFSKVSDAFAEFVSTGKVDFKKLTQSILKDVTKLALNSIWKQFMGQGAGGGTPGGGFLSGLFGGGGGGGGGGILGGLFGGGGGGGGLLSGLGGLLGFAEGGAFQVGGVPGRDRNLMSINGNPVAKVSKGETVNVSPSGATGGVTIVYNISTPNAQSFGESQGQLQAQAFASAQRANRRNN